jgi:uncharacterized protein (TIGR02145 family)
MMTIITKAIALLIAFSTVTLAQEKGTFTDTRDKKKYNTVKIGELTWLAENLNYADKNSKCYGEGGKAYLVTGEKVKLSKAEIQANCVKYGRLYDWARAMGIDRKFNKESYDGKNAKHQGICPVGWHLPSDDDWNALMKFVNPSCSDNTHCSKAGTKLKTSSGWNSRGGIPAGTDDYGFSALPGGFGSSDGDFVYAGNQGYWWSTSSDENYRAYDRVMLYETEDVARGRGDKSGLFSVRCVKD